MKPRVAAKDLRASNKNCIMAGEDFQDPVDGLELIQIAEEKIDESELSAGSISAGSSIDSNRSIRLKIDLLMKRQE